LGSKSSNNLSPQVQSGLLNNENQLVGLAQQQANNSQQLFNLALPGVTSAENFYGALSTGQPGAIAQAIAPEARQVAQATQGGIQNIQQNAPAGGEKNLAIEQALANQGSQVGQLATQAVTGSYNALAQLGGQNIGQSISAAGTGISGLSSANSALSSLGGLQLQNSQLNMEQKGQSLGAFGGLLGDASGLVGSTSKGGVLGGSTGLAALFA
jgi:hypothetical protein